MKIYAFYDTDIYGNEEYDIRGDSYEKLLRICCSNSSVLCLKFLFPDLIAADQLKAFEISKPKNITMISNSSCYCCVKFYRVCPELCDAMIGIAGGIFEWLCGWGFRNPDDPTFYRSDGTVFFVSEIHSGVCAIIPRKDECLEDILQVAPWLSGDDIWARDRMWLRKIADCSADRGQGDGSVVSSGADE